MNITLQHLAQKKLHPLIWFLVKKDRSDMAGKIMDENLEYSILFF